MIQWVGEISLGSLFTDDFEPKIIQNLIVDSQMKSVNYILSETSWKNDFVLCSK